MAEAAGIFVSHAHEDHAWCRTFVELLRQEGADVWYDDHDVGDGMLQDDIECELQARPIFIVILSPASVDNPTVSREMNAAIHLRDQNPERIIGSVVARKVEVSPAWSEYRRMSGPGERGITATEAAGQMIYALALSPAEAQSAAYLPAESETIADVMLRANGWCAQQRYGEALSAFEHALTLDPLNAYAWYGKGKAMDDYRCYSFEASLACYEQAVTLQPELTAAWKQTGHVLAHYALALEDSQSYEGALRAYEEAVRLDPLDAESWAGRSDVLFQLNREEEALASYERTLHLDPLNAEIWMQQCVVLRAWGRYEEALIAAEQAVALAPDDSVTWTRKGFVLTALERHKDALVAYEHALTLDPEDGYAWYGKGHSLARLGYHEAANSAYQQSLFFNPEDWTPVDPDR